MLRSLCVALCLGLPTVAFGDARSEFASIDGGTLDLEDWHGQPVLVVNTASLCGYTSQYAGLQALYDRYRDQGLVVLAVPSDSFNQEVGTEAEVRDFCELHFGLDLPMTEITPVRGRDAHGFYAWLRETHQFTPRWNFNKVLLDQSGDVVAHYGSAARPLSDRITGDIEALIAP